MTLSVRRETSEDVACLATSKVQARENHLECQELSAGSLFMDSVYRFPTYVHRMYFRMQANLTQQGKPDN